MTLKIYDGYQSYDQRKANKDIVSLASIEALQRESELEMVNNCFNGIDGKAYVFSLTERDDGKGFGVQMKNVLVVPRDYVCFKYMPKWLIWALSRVFCRVGNQRPDIANEAA